MKESIALKPFNMIISKITENLRNYKIFSFKKLIKKYIILLINIINQNLFNNLPTLLNKVCILVNQFNNNKSNSNSKRKIR